MEIFWRQGFEATSISDLTSAIGINPPSLYAAFGDKERLFLEAVERYVSECTALDALDEEGTTREAVACVLQTIAIEISRPDRPRGCMMITAAMNCSAESAHLQSALARRRQLTEKALHARIERGVADGDMPVGTDAASLARFFATVIQGMTIQSRDGANRSELIATAELAMRAWPDGNAARRGARA